MTILLADDHPIFRRGLRSVIRSFGFRGSILEAQNGREVLAIHQTQRIDLYILDYRMPEMNGYEASRVILRENPNARIIIISMYDDPLLISRFYQLGVQCFTDKSTDTNKIRSTILAIMNGMKANGGFEGGLPESKPLQFTQREKELIELLDRGFTSQAISQNLGLAYKTVETYRCRLLEKVRVKNTSELLGYCHRNGLI
jgi:DNA-binding NarL/FixJ family response regulator